MPAGSVHRASFVLVLVLGISAFFGPGVAAAATPTFTSFSPQYGPPGTAVSVFGNGFGAVTGVLFNGKAGSDFHRISTTALTAAVPAGSTTGPITLVTAADDPSTKSPFVVIAPRLTLSVSDGLPGTATTVSGSGFQPYDTVDVYVATIRVGFAPTTVRGEFTLAVTVPAAMVAGSVQVAATGRAKGYTGKSAFLVHTDWNEQGFSGDNQSSNPSETGITAANVSLLMTKFSSPHGASVMGAVGNSRVFFAQGGSIRAIQTSGGLSWTRAGGYSDAAPVLSGGVVYVGGTDGSVSALNAVTGVPIWRTVVNPGVSPVPVVKQVGLFDGKVYAASAVGNAVSLAAVTAADGGFLWTTPVESGVFKGFTVAEFLVVVTVNNTTASGLDGHLKVFNSETGQPAPGGSGVENLSMSRISHFVRNSAQRDLNIFTTAGQSEVMWSVDYPGGNARWFYDATPTVGAGISTDPVVAGDITYFAARSSDPTTPTLGVLAAVGTISGQPVWTQPLAFSRKPVVANGLLYAPCGPDGDLFVFNAATGAQLLRRDYPCGDIFVVNGRVYIDAPGTFTAYGLSDEHTALSVLNDTVTGTAPYQLMYSANWSTSTHPGAYLNNVHSSTTANSTVTVKFTGNGMRFWYSTAPNYGNATVSIDGGSAIAIDQWSASRADGLTSWTSPQLAVGEHTAVIKVLGTKRAAATDVVVTVDRIDIGRG